ncbi:PAS domain S-box protein [Desulfosporosinus sp. PR]|uniref:PAS domain S-box protein n=1 Tax=Candidatus Desulfosporosinus nitrosoreducens TaxID=3401928 RepID=UPI0027EEB3DC|nr:PAS domain S-box protein [Desulfosporosinus sp. PR]MDQ7092524.1 PAS domain S-box protein [Desulfosporosinus sp. PR]
MQNFLLHIAYLIVLVILFLAFSHIYKQKNKELKSLNAQLQLRSTYFDEIFKNSQDGILIIDYEGKVIKTNKSFQRIFQYKNTEIAGLNVGGILIDADNQESLKIYEKVMQGQTVTAETSRFKKDGSVVEVKLLAFPIKLETNKNGICVIYKDIAYEKSSMKALELQKIYFRKLFENSPEAICILDTEDKFIDVNAAFEKVFGYAKEELLNCSINNKIVAPEFISEATELSENVIKGNIIEYETLRSRKNGSFVNVHILGYPLIFEDRRIGVFGIYKDITEQKRAEEALKASELTFRTLFEGSSDAILILDDNKFVDCNPATLELLGYDSKENIIGKSLWELSPQFQAKDISSQEKALDIIKTVQKNKKFEWLLRKNDGTLVPVEVMLTSILLNEKRVFHVLWRDISERKELEQRLEYLSYHDFLTGLYNRRFFEEELKRLDVKRNYPLTVVVADVNGLKLVNDSFGHSMGDKLLKTVAEVMKSACRADDIIARLGGDEFVLLLPKTKISKTDQILQRIKTLAAQEKVGSIDLSVSFGYETKNHEGENIQEILKKAEDYMYKKKLFESPSMRGKTINAIISTLHEKNKREEQHSHRVSALSKRIGEALSLSEGQIEELKTVGLLHDIGKIAIEETILNKPGKLTEEEWEEIKRHPEIGYRILSTVNDMSEMADYVLAHHERWDGKGYPKGLRGIAIPLQARIIAIADTYDAITSERSYRQALPEKVAFEELRNNAGIQFDPDLVEVFLNKVLDQAQAV